ncbi:MAG: hypothetical protein KGI38_12860 [Thaumarchaeota archaeon]|nr:hypothetical protein [Nitrososphaerota archaeon]
MSALRDGGLATRVKEEQDFLQAHLYIDDCGENFKPLNADYDSFICCRISKHNGPHAWLDEEGVLFKGSEPASPADKSAFSNDSERVRT